MAGHATRVREVIGVDEEDSQKGLGSFLCGADLMQSGADLSGHKLDPF
jgi:hypothetical protein